MFTHLFHEFGKQRNKIALKALSRMDAIGGLGWMGCSSSDPQGF